MRKKLNVRLLAILLAVALVTGTAVHLLHGVQVRHSTRLLLSNALQAEESGRPGRAISYLNMYLRFEPDGGRTPPHI